MMDGQRFLSIVEAYGAEPRRWPAAEREAAEAFARTDPEAAGALAEAAALEAVLDASVPPQPSAATRRRILEAAPRRRRSAMDLGWWISGAGLAAAGVAGVVFGTTLSASPADPQVQALLAEAEAYEDIQLLAEGDTAS
jgi:ferric-dicitrate binding protein FerR (iron transport regulator)